MTDGSIFHIRHNLVNRGERRASGNSGRGFQLLSAANKRPIVVRDKNTLLRAEAGIS